VLGLAQGERAVQDEHFELFTVTEIPKMSEIWNFQNFDKIFKKSRISQKRLELGTFCKKPKQKRKKNVCNCQKHNFI